MLEPAEGLLLGSHHEVALSHVQDGAHIPHLQDKPVTVQCTVTHKCKWSQKNVMPERKPFDQQFFPEYM